MAILLLLLIINSCEINNVSDPYYSYDYLFIRVQDVFGNDLVKGIEYDWWQSDVIPEEEAINGQIKHDLYTLDFIYPDPCMNPFSYQTTPGGAAGYDKSAPILSLYKIDGYYHLYSESIYSMKPYPAAEMITIKLSCPYVFGGNAEQKIITYWKSHNNNSFFCSSIEFNGNKYTTQRFSTRADGALNSAIVTITK